MKKKSAVLKNSLILFLYLLIIWGFYRSLFHLPEEIEEVIVKPILWLFPVFYLVRREGKSLKSLGLTRKNLFPAIALSLALGIVFVVEGLILNYVKYQGFNFGANIGDKPLFLAIAISFVTAFVEEVTFRGYIFTRLWQGFKNEFFANFVTSAAWVIIHIPITVFVLKLDFSQTLVFLGLAGVFSLGTSFIFARTKNIFSSVFLHVLWQWPIILFR